MLFLVKTPGSKNQAVYPALNATQAQHGWDTPAQGPGPSSQLPSPLCQVGVRYFLASTSQSTVMGDGTPQPYWKKISQGVRGHQLKTLSGILSFPAICWVLQLCLSSCITSGIFWQSPLYSHLLHRQGHFIDRLVAVQRGSENEPLLSTGRC